jgi:hypothetical protein
MDTGSNIFLFRSTKSEGLCGFSPDSKGDGLPAKFAPWTGIGVFRGDQNPPHGFSRDAIQSGIEENGYQLWRQKKKS